MFLHHAGSRKICNRVIIINKGKVVAVRTARIPQS